MLVARRAVTEDSLAHYVLKEYASFTFSLALHVVEEIFPRKTGGSYHHTSDSRICLVPFRRKVLLESRKNLVIELAF